MVKFFSLAAAFAAAMMTSAVFAADVPSPSDRPVAKSTSAEPVKDRQGRVVAWASPCTTTTNCVQFKDAQGRPTHKVVRSGRSFIIYDRQGRRK
jgi:hypothetical protein